MADNQAEDRVERLEAAMNERRQELGLRWKDVADRADVSEETVRAVRRGVRRAEIRTTSTEAKIERALRWERGGIQAIRDGGQPIPLPGCRGSATGTGNSPGLLRRLKNSRRGVLPDFVKGDPAYQAIWELPEELLSEAERRHAITQIELLRWMKLS